MPAPVPPGPQPPQSDGFFSAIRRTGLYRSDERWVGGVAGGLAGRLGIDPLLVRGIVAVTFLLGGLGLVAYGVAWALLPEQRDGRIHLEETIRGRFDAALLGAAALVVLGLARGDSWFGWGANDGFGWFPGGLAVVALIVVVVLLVAAGSRRGSTGTQQPGPYGPFPVPPYGPPAPGAGAPPAGPATRPSPADAPPYGAPSPYGASPASSFATPGPHGLYGAAPAPRPMPGPMPGQMPGQMPVQARPAPAPVSLAPSTRAPGPGSAVVGTVVALSLLTFAALLAASRTGSFDEPVLLTGAAVTVVLLGLGIVVSGLRGRRSGVLGFLAIVAILLAGPIAVGENNDWHWDQSWNTSNGTQSLQLTTRQQAEDGFSMGLGDATIDLTDVPLTGTTLDVPLHVGLGSLTVLVPPDVPLVADVQTGAGETTWDVGDDTSTVSGAGNGERRFSSDEVDDGAEPQLALHITLGAGDVTIKESR